MASYAYVALITVVLYGAAPYVVWRIFRSVYGDR